MELSSVGLERKEQRQLGELHSVQFAFTIILEVREDGEPSGDDGVYGARTIGNDGICERFSKFLHVQRDLYSTCNVGVAGNAGGARRYSQSSGT